MRYYDAVEMMRRTPFVMAEKKAGRDRFGSVRVAPRALKKCPPSTDSLADCGQDSKLKFLTAPEIHCAALPPARHVVVCCRPLQGFHQQATHQLSVTIIKSRRFLTKAESGSMPMGEAGSKP
jgi:hypothetical protein